MSHDGQVVVGYADHRVARWVNGVMQIIEVPTNILPHPYPSPGGCATGVSADGSTVVGYIGAGWFTFYAFYWTPETGIRLVPGTSVLGFSFARDVSADGNAIVGWALLPQQGYVAYQWTPQAGVWNLSVLLGSTYGQASATTPDGSVIVGYDTISQSQYQFQTVATLWTTQGQAIVLGTLDDAPTFATAVSPDGRVVVGFGEPGRPPLKRPFRWTQETGIQELGPPLPSNESAEATSVAANGVVVGSVLSPYESRRAFIWTESEGFQDLNVRYASLLAPHARLTNANAVSPDGRYIVGQGYNPQFGRREAYILDTWPRGEVNGNGCVSNDDLLAVLFAFGTPGTGYTRHEDINKDGIVNNADLLAVLLNFGHGYQ